MCDTFVAIYSNRKENTNSENEKKSFVVFGKNSDRPSDEIQLVTFYPRRYYEENSGSELKLQSELESELVSQSKLQFKAQSNPNENGRMLKTTYISISEVKETAAVLLSQPYWMWGAEMGVNEYGVAIGNEAVWTAEPLKSNGLLGMDLVRLGLERGKNAQEALLVITNLLDAYGQGGDCSIDGSMNYHNSFLIADRNEAWVLETAGEWWVAERITEGFRNISNDLSISDLGDLRREGLEEYLDSKGLEHNFAKAFSEYGWSPILSRSSREGECRFLLKKTHQFRDGSYNSNRNDLALRIKKYSEILRDHKAGICMHGGFLSAGSQLSILSNDPEIPELNFFTGTAPPCKSVYHPFIFSQNCKGLTNLSKNGKAPEFPIYDRDIINRDWIWLKHQQFLSDNLAQSDSLAKKFAEKIETIENRNFNLILERNLTKEKILKRNHESWNEFLGLIQIIYQRD